jgi:MoaA/NifB/PqqE/SkfB family radical SAM enzyme
MKDIYNQQKALCHRDRITTLIEGKHPAPVHVQLLPTNRCNSACQWCAYRQSGYSSNETFFATDEIPFNKLEEIVADCAAMGVRAIEVTGGGEPTMHPQHAELMESIVERGMDLGVVTNGVILRHHTQEAILNSQWVRVSIDAGTRHTYATTRNVSMEVFESVRKHIKTLADKRQSAAPTVGVGFVVTPQNWKEVAQATRNAHEDGADNIRIGAMFSNEGGGYTVAIRHQLSELLQEAKSFETETFKIYDLVSDRIAQLLEGSPAHPKCWHQSLATLIGADQNVYRCCVVAYNHIGLIGSIRDKRFLELWQSPGMGQQLLEFDARQCPRCIRAASNAAIADCISSKTIPQVICDHANFI